MTRNGLPVMNSRGRLYGLLAIAAAALLLFALIAGANNATAQTPADGSTPAPVVHTPEQPVWSDYMFTTATTSPPAMPIGAGGSNSCRLEPDGTATCWGQDDQGQSSPPADDTFTTLAVGESHSCGLRTDGTAVCWGNNDNGQATPPAGETFTGITVGGSHSCGLRADGTVRCWGSNDRGQSTPPTSSTSASLRAAGGQPLQTRSLTFNSISAGDVHTCGVRPGGVAVCWGDTGDGRTTPPSGETLTAESLSAGGSHNCGLRDDGTPVCWGGNADGQSTPPSGQTLTALSAGGSHTCGLRGDGSVSCWGSDANGQSTPPTSGVFTSLSAGSRHTCGLRSDGEVICWGDNAAKQTDVPPSTGTASPTPTGTASPTATGTASPTATATPDTTAERLTGLERQVGRLTRLISQLTDTINDLLARVASLENAPTVEVPTATPTMTPTTVSSATPTMVPSATPTMTPTTVPGATPTMTATPTVAANCIQNMGLGWLTGTWREGCESSKTPENAEAGTRYARYYTFTLNTTSDVTVMVTSDDVANPYTYLLEGVGNHGVIVATHASRISQRLQPGSYTIEATTYNMRATGDFTLTLDIARVRR